MNAGERDSKVVSLYQSGLSTNQIAVDMGIGRTTAKRAIKKAGISPRGPANPRPSIKGENHHAWKGGHLVGKPGRLYFRYQSKTPLHRAVAEAILARPLHKGETVHHVNECKLDNRPANLWVFPTTAAHTRFHHTGEIHPDTIKLIPYCGEVA